MAAVDFVTGYITNYVDGLVRPYVEQGAAAVGDVAGGVLFSAGDKIAAAGRGVGGTINGYSTGVGNSISGVAKSIPGAPAPTVVPSGLSASSPKPKAVEAPKSSSLPASAPKLSDPRNIDRPPMPTTAAGRKQELERLKAKGITRAKENAAAKKPSTGADVKKPVPSGAAASRAPASKPSGPESLKPEEGAPEEVRRSRRAAKRGKRPVRT